MNNPRNVLDGTPQTNPRSRSARINWRMYSVASSSIYFVAGIIKHMKKRVPHTNREIYEKKPEHGGAYAGGAVHSADQRIRKPARASGKSSAVSADSVD